jgi:hypothetical protein
MPWKMICSHWILCGWIAWLIISVGVDLFQRYAHPSRFTSLKHFFPDLSKFNWENRRTRYAKIPIRTEDERLRIDRFDQYGLSGGWPREDGPAWS